MAAGGADSTGAAGGSMPTALDAEDVLAGTRVATGAGADCAGGVGSDGRGTSRLHTASPTIDAARLAPLTIAAVRFHRLVEPLACTHRQSRTSCMSGRRSGCLSSARAITASTEGGIVRRRWRIGTGVSARWFARTSSRVAARNGGTPQSIS